MRRFVFIIGSMDDFKDAEALKEAHQENELKSKSRIPLSQELLHLLSRSSCRLRN